MRKIEQDMLKALRDRRDWKAGNTAVHFTTLPNDKGHSRPQAVVTLHGNPIAVLRSDGALVACVETFERWATSTTASRLRALGFGASIRGGEPHLERTKITARNQGD